MSTADHEITHVSDTALMVAACRALETERPDGFVRDPFAARLAGPRGMAIARALPRLEVMCFGIGVRSRFLDDLIPAYTASLGIRNVLTLGCGLDSRPWRLDLPANLRWIEVDYPEMLDYKSGILASEKPKCILERIPADLSIPAERSAVFAAAAEAPSLMITEGLLMYLPGSAVEGLAEEAAHSSGIGYWLSDLTTPAFARRVGMDTFRTIAAVRSEGSLDGLQILEVMERYGWTSMVSRTYVKDIWSFALERAKGMRDPDAPPPPPVAPDDPTGIHLFHRANA